MFYEKKINEIDKKERLSLIDLNSELSVRKQVKLLNVCKSSIYYKHVINDDSEMANMINEIYLSSGCRYGYRKIGAEISCAGVLINNKKILRIMKDMKIEGLYPKKSCNASIKDKENKIYPYLLKGLNITKPNQVWATDITYISINGKFMYFMAIIDLYSRYIISKELSPSLESGFCVYTLKEAFKQCVPEIFNTDQGSQFTSNNFINELEGAGVKISMDHKGRCFDNIFVERLWRTIKQEAIYFYRPSSVKELEVVLEDFVSWYNNKRRHQSLSYKRPVDMYYEN